MKLKAWLTHTGLTLRNEPKGWAFVHPHLDVRLRNGSGDKWAEVHAATKKELLDKVRSWSVRIGSTKTGTEFNIPYWW